MPVLSYSASEEQIQTILSSCADASFKTPPAYARFQFAQNGCVITVYQSGKVVFQGAAADTVAARFFTPVIKELVLPQAGSDEVGTGDYFGPVCVCATYIDSAIYARIKDLNIIDSKQLTDPVIIQIARQLMKEIPYSLTVLMPQHFNEISSENNMNRIKARMHNQCYLNLQKKGIALPKLVVIDQFCPPASYYSYLNQEKDIVRGIHFQPKAENSYLAVGCGAIIARYAFVSRMAEMAAQWDMELPKGAGSAVDAAARQFVKRYGQDSLGQIAKLNFKNTARL